MAYIYQIINDINQKSYVGKTERTLEQRFQEHCRAVFDSRCEKRPLYVAMKKYGIEHFHISLLEETQNPEERECFWIEKLGTFKNGYNATCGGDGKHYCDYDLIYALYKEGKTLKEIAKILNYTTDTCTLALNHFKVPSEERFWQGRFSLSKPVLQLDKNTEEIINIYPSIGRAQQALNVASSGHISQVCLGKRKTAYGYKWRYCDI
jgi:hypothetical protein